jgi:hypothetical protein
MEDEPKVFSTRDLYLASTLVTLHLLLLGTDMQYEGLKQKPIGYFKFNDTPELRKTLNDYNQGLILVEPRLYMSNLQSLKADVTNFTYNPTSEYNKRNAI